jgi:hypothetical protein
MLAAMHPASSFGQELVDGPWRREAAFGHDPLEHARHQPVLAQKAPRPAGEGRWRSSLGQLGDVGGDAARFVTGKQLGRRAPSWLILEIGRTPASAR